MYPNWAVSCLMHTSYTLYHWAISSMEPWQCTVETCTIITRYVGLDHHRVHECTLQLIETSTTHCALILSLPPTPSLVTVMLLVSLPRLFSLSLRNTLTSLLWLGGIQPFLTFQTQNPTHNSVLQVLVGTLLNGMQKVWCVGWTIQVRDREYTDSEFTCISFDISEKVAVVWLYDIQIVDAIAPRKHTCGWPYYQTGPMSGVI